MRALIPAFCSILLFPHHALAQQTLVPNGPATRTLAPGKTDSFPVSLNDGDYITASLAQDARVDLTIRYVDGSILRQVEGPAEKTKDSFAFAAEGGGLYSIAITNPGTRPARYELLLESIVPLDDRLRPAPPDDPTPGHRIEALKSQLESGEAGTDAFWKEIAARGTPLAEPFGSDGRYQLVTFLWRSTHATRNVLVIGSFWGVGAPSAYAMRQLPGSDVWYLTLKLPSGARFTYQLSPNDPMTSEGSRAEQRAMTRQADPLSLNPLSACPPDTSKFECESVAELPGAAPQPWLDVKPGIARGRIEKRQIKSNIQKLDRPFSVYTPANYAADGPPNALLILFDGEDLSSDTFRLATMDNLIAASKIQRTVVVFVENLPGRRLVDLVANPAFADFLATELMPWVRAHYNVSKEATKIALGGFSAGGLAAPYVALRHPEVFGNVLSVSGAFWWSPEHNGGVCGAPCPDSRGRGGDGSRDATTEGNFIVKQVLASPRLPLRFYLAAGTFESDSNGGGGGILETTRQLRDVLLAKGYEVRYQQFVGGHDGLSWRGALADGLIALLGPREVASLE
jgi:enterochelin esterase-like enzyme